MIRRLPECNTLCFFRLLSLSLKRCLLYFFAIQFLISCVANVEEPNFDNQSVLAYSPTLSLTDQTSSYDVGFAAIGGFYDLTIHVFNIGKTEATGLIDKSVGGNFQFDTLYPGTGGDCADTLAPGASCKLVIRYSPPDGNIHLGEIKLEYSDIISGTKTASIQLQGQGGTPASLAISENPFYDFGISAIGTVLNHAFVITNSGQSRAVTLSEVGLDLPIYSLFGGVWPGTGGTCGVEILGGDACTVVVSFVPNNVGLLADAIDVSYFDGVGTQVSSRNVQGTGVVPANLEISEVNPYDYGTWIIGQSQNKLFTVTNTGGMTATAIALSGLVAPFEFSGAAYPGLAGNCGVVLAQGASCTIEVAFTPTVSGVQTLTTSLAYNNGVLLTEVTKDLQGTGITPALLVISDGGTHDFGTQAIGSVTNYVFTVTNSGETAATLMGSTSLASPFSYFTGVYPGLNGTCGFTLPGGASCTVEVSFNPIGLGPFADSIEINYNDGLAVVQANRAVEGVGANAAVLSFTEAPTYNFNTVVVGGSATALLNLNNTGGVPATTLSLVSLANPYSYVGGTFPGAGGDCAATLGAGSSCTIEVSFSPVSSGLQTVAASWSYFDGAAGQPVDINLTGAGGAAAILVIDQTNPFDFGSLAVGATSSQVFRVSNIGGVDGTAMGFNGLANPFRFTGGSFPGTGGDCGITLAPGTFCLVDVEFAPTGIGAVADTLLIDYNNGMAVVQATKDLLGSGVGPAVVNFQVVGLYDFGVHATGSDTTAFFTLENTGGLDATVLTPSGLTTPPFDFTGGTYPGIGGTCGNNLAAGSTCTIAVEYAPTVGGVVTQTLQIAYNNGALVVPITKDYRGSAVAPAMINIDKGPTFDYAQRATGSQTTEIFTLDNSGGVTATLMNGTGLALPFQFEGGLYPGTNGDCGVTLPAGANCTIAVVFAPTALAVANDIITINYDNGVIPQVTPRGVTGVGVAPASLTVAGANPFSYSTHATSTVTSNLFTITNGGGYIARDLNALAIVGPFNYAGGAYPGTGGNCLSTLAAGALCTVEIEFSPTASGLATSQFDIQYSDGANLKTLSHSMEGTGADPANLIIGGSDPLDFGSYPIGTLNTFTVTIANNGGVGTTLTTGSALTAPFSYEGGGAFPGATGSCLATLAPGASCTVTVDYNPLAAAVDTDTLQINYNNGLSATSVSKTVQATATSPADITISLSNPFNYGMKATGSNTDQTFVLTNTGSVNATAVVLTLLAGPFTFKGGSAPGLGGDCGPVLTPGSTCTTVITFSPVALGAFTNTLSVDFHNGVGAQIRTKTLDGAGVAPALLGISEVNPYDYMSVTAGTSMDHVFTITNTGGVPAESMVFLPYVGPFSYTGGSFPGTGGDCGATLAPLPALNTCTINVRFSPMASGLFTDTVSINYYDGASNQNSPRLIQGTGTLPASISISDGPSYDYGAVAIGSFSVHTLTLTNTGGSGAAGMSGGGLNPDFAFVGGGYPGGVGTCGLTLAPGISCTIQVEFRPTGAGALTDTIEINYNDGVAAQVTPRIVTGTGAVPALLTISDGAIYDFTTIATGGGFADHLFLISNTGGSTATGLSLAAIAGPYAITGGTYPGSGGTCSASLAPGSDCLIAIRFTPVVSGTFSETITLNYNNGVVATSVPRGVTGVGAAPATISIDSGPTYDYLVQATGSITNNTFTVSNGGGVTATSMNGVNLAAPYNFLGGTYPGTGGTCGATLAATDNCTVIISFAPVAVGTFTDILNMNYDNGNGPTNSARPLTGEGALPANLALTGGPTFSYGLVPVGGSADVTFTVSNGGGVDATLIADAGLIAPFRYTGGGGFPGATGTCTTTLPAAGNCIIDVEFSPTVTGLLTQNLPIRYNDGALLQSVSIDVQGTGVNPALLIISDGPGVYDFGTLPLGGSSQKIFTVINTGAVSATVVTGAALGAQFDYTGGLGYPGTLGTCGGIVLAGASCTIEVEYAPLVTSPADTITMALNYNNGAIVTSSTRDLRGAAVTRANLTLSEVDPYDYQTVAIGAFVSHTFEVTNSGEFTATALAETTLVAPYTFLGGSYPGTGGTCTATLAAGDDCDLVIIFTAPGPAAIYSGVITMDYNDGVAPASVARTLTGASASPASLDIVSADPFPFGSVTVGGGASTPLTINNTGGVSATAISEITLSAPYRFTGGGGFPGAGGTCADPITAAGSCVIHVEYLPTTTGLHSGILTLQYFDGATTQTEALGLSGTGAGPAELTITEIDPYNFGSVAVGATSSRVFTISNIGGTNATAVAEIGLSAPYGYTGGGLFPGVPATCGGTINAGTSCTINLTFTPTVAGVFPDAIDIQYNDGLAVQNTQRAITGTGTTAAQLTIDDSLLFDYGTVAAGSATDHTFTVSNSGGATATGLSEVGLAAPYSFVGGGYPGTGGTCNGSLIGGGTCTLVVRFNPGGIGVFPDTLNIAYNNGVASANAVRPVTGTAQSPALLTISDGPTYDYNSVGLTDTIVKTFTIDNTGGFGASAIEDALTLSPPFRYLGGGYPGTAATCGVALAAGSSCTLFVEFAPTTLGLHTSAVTLDYYDGAANQTVARAIQGTGIEPANIIISEADPYDYGQAAVGSITLKTFTLTNNGGVSTSAMTGSLVTGTSYGFESGGGFPGATGTCLAILAPLSSCTIVVQFTPGSAATFSDTVRVTYNDGAGIVNSDRGVTGQGVPAASLTISDIGFDFSLQAVGSTTTKEFTINNIGSVVATGIGESGLAAPYNLSGGFFPGSGGTCGASLAPGSQCTIVVAFSPVGVGTFPVNIQLDYNDGTAIPTNSINAITGSAAAAAILSLAPAAIFDYGQQPTGSVTTQVFTLDNTGGVPATSIVIDGLTQPFDYVGGSYPGTGGDCGGSLGTGPTCTIVVAFNPLVIGVQADAIDVAYDDGATNQNFGHGIQGEGITPANLVITDGPTYDYGWVDILASENKVFTINNTGATDANLISGAGLAAPFTFTGGNIYPGGAGSCGGTIVAGGSCTIEVTFDPVVTGVFNDEIEINYNNGATVVVSRRPVAGTGIVPANLTISDAGYDYGTEALGSRTDKTFTITNTGGVTATSMSEVGLLAPFVYVGGYPGDGGTCGLILGAAPAPNTCTIVVSYQPVPAVGVDNDTIDFSYNDGTAVPANSTNAITGTGALAASLAITPGSPHDFGTLPVGGSVDQLFTVTNSGGVPATGMLFSGLGSPFDYTGGAFPGDGGDCGASLGVLPAPNTCTVEITYNPSATGVNQDILVLDYDDGAIVQVENHILDGQSVSLANLTISDGPGSYDYGTVAIGATSSVKLFTVTNTGGFGAAALGESGLSGEYRYAGGGLYPGVGGDCGATLAAGATCLIAVDFVPVLPAGVKAGTLQMDYNNGVAVVNSTRLLTGTAAPAALLTIDSGPTYDFGLVASLGGSSTHSFDVSNGGGVDATGVTEVGLALPYRFLGGTYPGTGGNCGVTITSGSTCNVVLEFVPTANGTVAGTLNLEYSDGTPGVENGTRALTGTGGDAAVLDIAGGGLFNFNTVATGSKNEQIFTVTNGGDLEATSIVGNGLALPYQFKDGSYPGTGGTCGASLGAAPAPNTCTIVVTYEPVLVAVHNDTINLDYADGTGSASSTKPLEGTAAAPASLAMTVTPHNYGPLVVGGTSSQLFTITNSGGVPAVGIADAGVLALPFRYTGGGFPGTGGDCGPAIAGGGGTCTIDVEFLPISTGLFGDTITLSYDDGAFAQQVTGGVSGTGVSAALLSISDGPGDYDYGTVAIGAVPSKTFTVTNTGSTSATVVSSSIVSGPSEFSVSGGSCGVTILSGSSCTVIVDYTPLVAAVHADVLRMSYNDGVMVQTTDRGLDGTGVLKATLTISDAGYDYGTKATGSTTLKLFTVTNTGSFTATGMGESGIGGVYSFTGGGYPGLNGTCGASLVGAPGPGNTCLLEIAFAPLVGGVFPDAIQVDYNDGVGGVNVISGITGAGAAPASVAMTPGSPFDYTSHVTGTTTLQTFTLTNSGGVPATGVALADLAAPFRYEGGGGFPGATGDCGPPIAGGGGTCTIKIEYVPVTTGPHSNVLEISYNDGAADQDFNHTIQGTGTSPALLSIAGPSPYDYGTVAIGATVTATFTVTNNGGFATAGATGVFVTPGDFEYEGGGSYPGATGTCGGIIAAGASCTVTVDYVPTTAAADADTLRLDYNDGFAAVSTSVGLEGVGALKATLTISDAGYDYGTEALGSRTDKTFTITNTGGVTATSMSEVGLLAPFVYVGGYPGDGGTCGLILGAAPAPNTCTIVVSYQPVPAVGVDNDTIDFSYNDGTAVPANSTNAITGTGALAASLAITPGSPHDFGTLPVGGSVDQLFTVTNSGGVPATGMLFSGLGSPFDYTGGAFPGDGGDCGASLGVLPAPNTCTVEITYNPSATGVNQDILVLDYDDGAIVQVENHILDGQSVSLANLTISDGPGSYDYGTVAIGATSSVKLFTVTNTGGFGAAALGESGLSGEYRYAGGGLYPGVGGDCGATLAAGATCLIAVDFVPVLPAGVKAGTLQMDYNNGVAVVNSTRLLTGTAAPAALLTIDSGPTYDFGLVASLGGSSTHSFDVSNGGGVDATGVTEVGLALPYRFLGGTYPGTGGNCGVTITSGSTCNVVLEFVPTANGTVAGTLNLEYSDGTPGVENGTRALTGTGGDAAVLDIAGGGLFNFNTVATGSKNEQIFTVTNGGDLEATSIVGNGLALPYQFKDGSYPGTGGTCGASLGAAPAPNTCTIVVTYEPVLVAVHNDTINLDYADGTGSASSTKPLEGTAAAPASLAMTVTPHNYGPLVVGGTSSQLFTITNSGGVPAVGIADAGVLALPFRYTGGGFPGTGGDCGPAIAGGGGTCTIDVEFLPISTGLFGDTITLSYDDGAFAQQVTGGVSGTGVSAALLSISDGPGDYDYGTVAIGAVPSKTFTVTNTGSTSATVVSSSIVSGPSEFSVSGGSCGVTILSGSSCTVIVDYTPLVAAVHADVLRMSYNDGVMVQTTDRGLDGTGVLKATLTISDAGYDYGTKATGSTTLKLFTVTNTGSFTATGMGESGIGGVYSFTGGGYPGLNGTCGASLVGAPGPGNTCLLEIAFAPLVGGVFPDAIQVDYNDGVGGVNVISGITGAGAAPASVAMTPGSPFDYTSHVTGTTTLQTFTLTNSGGVPATGVALADLAAPFRYEGGGGFPGATGDCGPPIAGGGGTCTIKIEYVPVTTGPHSNVLEISYNDGAADQDFNHTIQGTGTSPALLSIAGPSPYDYGTVAIGATVTATFTVTNNGGFATAGATGVFVTPGDFEYEGGGSYPGATGTCGGIIAAGASCTVTVDYVPTTAAADADTLRLDYNDGFAAVSTSVGLEGVGALKATLTISDAGYDYGTEALGSRTDKTFTITNTGGVTATSMSEVGLLAPFVYVGGYPGDGGTCGLILGAAPAPNTCTIVVSYQPVPAVGVDNDTIDFSYNDGTAVPANSTNAITGTGALAASLAITPGSPHDFGTLPVGGSVDQLFTVTNSGGVPATGMLFSGLGSPFDYTGGAFPGDGGDCGASLGVLPAPNTCTVEITYNPSATGVNQDILVLDYDDGAIVQVENHILDGQSVSLANLTISDGPGSYDYGTVAIGATSSVKLFTVTNTGGFGAAALGESGLSGEYRYAGGGLYPGVGGDCGATLAAGATCLIAVDFVPVLPAGVKAGTLQMDYNNGVAVVNSTRLLTGTAAPAALLTIDSGPTYDFGLVASLGGSSTHSFDVSNGGGVDATGVTEVGLALPYRFLGGTYPGTGGNCGVTITSGSTCNVVLEFVPTANGTVAGTLNLEYSDGTPGVENGTRALTGTGGDAAVLDIAGGGLFNFNTVATGSKNEQIFTVTNGGDLEATSIVGNGLALPYQFKDGSYPGTGGTCGASLGAAPAPNTCTIVVTYEPVLVAVHNDTINLDYADGTGSASSTKPLEGTAAAPASLAMTVTPHNYGPLVVGGTSSQLFTITNSGGVPAVGIADAGVLALPFRYTGGGFPGTGGDCGPAIAGGGGTCTIDVEFLPISTGLFGDTITLSYDDGAFAQQVTGGVSGTGVSAALLSISDGPGDYDYGTVAIGAVPSKTFTVTNTGSTSATVVSSSIVSGPSEFSVSGGSCGVTILSGSSCTVIVDYTPLVAAVHADVLRMSYNDGVMVQTTDRGLDGTGVLKATLTISDAGYDYGTKATGSTTLKLFTVTNTGSFTATGMGESGIGGVYSFTGGGYPGLNGTCGASLVGAPGPGNTCLLEIAFAPLVGGVFPDAIQVDYNDGVGGVNVISGITGAGAAPASVAMTPGSPFDYTSHVTGTTTLQTFTLTNSGGVPATGVALADLAAPFRYEGGGGFPGATGDCGPPIAGGGGTCTIKIEYVPVTTGPHSNVLEISYNDGAADQDFNHTIQGTGTSPALLSIAGPSPYDYGTVAIGATVTATFTVTNNGGFATAGATGVFVTPGDFEYEGGGSYPGATGTCGGIIAAGASCTVTVDYVPTTAAADADTLRLDYNDGFAAVSTSVGLEGVGALKATLTISDAGYDYGTVVLGSSATKEFTITNVGGVDATSIGETGLGGVYGFLGGAYPGTGGTCGLTLSGGSSTCTIVVRYAPAVAGIDNDTVIVGYNDGTLVPASVNRPITGTGAEQAELTISGAIPYDFSTVVLTQTSSNIFTVTNTGGVAATAMVFSGIGGGSPFDYTGGGGFPGAGGDCGASLAAAPAPNTCTIDITFAPTVTGVQSDTLDLDYNNGSGPTIISRLMQGSGTTAASLVISDLDPFDFGNVTVSSTATKTFTITNIGGATASALTGNGLAATFGFEGAGAFPGATGTCILPTLAAGASCTVVVAYTPVGAVLTSDILNIDYNDGTGLTNETKNVEGTGVASAVLAIGSGPTQDFGDIVSGQASSHVFTVTYSGGTPATAVSETTLAGVYNFLGGSYPGTGGTCGTTITSSCTLVVEFAPLVNGNYPGTLTLNYFDGAATQNVARALDGDGVNVAGLTISGADPFDFQTLLTSIAPGVNNTFTITNTGGATATSLGGLGLALPYSFAGGGGFPGAGGDCLTTLASGDTCDVVVNFKPTFTGTTTDDFDINFDDGTAVIQTVTKNIEGTGYLDGALLSLLNPAVSPGADDTPEIRVSGVLNGLEVRLYREAGCTNLMASGTAPGAIIDLTSAPIPAVAGTHEFHVTYEDSYTNVSGCSTNFVTYQYDPPPPSPSGWTLDLATDDPDDGSTSNDNTPEISGTGLVAENGSQVRIYDNLTCAEPAVGTATIAGGIFTVNNINYPIGGVADNLKDFHGKIVDIIGSQSACTDLTLEYILDTVDPDPPASIDYVPATNTWTSINTSTPLVGYTASPSGDVAGYELGISISPTGGNSFAGWDLNALLLNYQFTGLAPVLNECTDYYISVRSFDAASNYSVSRVTNNQFQFDSQNPIAPASITLTGVGTTKRPKGATWPIGTDNCAVDHYEYAIGFDSNGSGSIDPGEEDDEVAWKNIGNVLTFRDDNLTLSYSTDYYISVRTVDRAGRASAVRTSSAFQIYDPTFELPSMIAWLDGAVPTTLIDENGRDATDPLFTGNLDDWLDNSGSAVAHDFNASVAARRPIYDPLTFETTFSGVDDGLRTPNHAEINTATVTERNITAAIRTDFDISSTQVIYEEGGGTRGMNIYVSSGRLYCGFWNRADSDGVQNFTAVSTVATPNTRYDVTWIFDYSNYTGAAGPDGHLECFVNGTSIGTATTTSRLFAHGAAVGLGYKNNATFYHTGNSGGTGHFFRGEILEFMLFNGTPTTADVLGVHGYLESKW